MKRGTLPPGIAPILLFTAWALAAPPAHALWVEVPVTASGVYDGRQFTIQVRDASPFREFEVTIAPRPKAVSPFLGARLSLIARDEWVASVPVSEVREDGTVRYRFRVAPGALAQSSFEIHASAFVPARGGPTPFRTAVVGKQKVEQIMGGTVYTIKLSSFARADTPPGKTDGDAR